LVGPPLDFLFAFSPANSLAGHLAA
jgi:hypothetical protein